MSKLNKNSEHKLKTTSFFTIDEWLQQQGKQDLLRFITCGSVDDGKSTLIGRLLWESQQIFEDQLSGLEKDSKRYGTQGSEIDFALLVDGLAAEREQGITIDVAYRFFSSAQRKFIVADTPGHEEYTRNMITAASNADLAVLLIDANHGLLTQTRRHAYIASLVGVRHILIAINKMDLVNYDEKVFSSIVDQFSAISQVLKFDSIGAIPLSALKGDNVTNRSLNMSWFTGPTLMGYLETLKIQDKKSSKLVFPVQWVNRPNPNFRGFSGTLVSGHINLGDTLRVTSSGQIAKLSKIVTADRDLTHAIAGDAVTLVLDREVDASRGDILSLAKDPLDLTDQFEATLVWMHGTSGHTGRTYDLKMANQSVSARITSIKYRVDVNTQAHTSCKELVLNDIAVVSLALSRPLVYSSYDDSKVLGGFILIDKFTNATVAAGMIRHNLRRAQNIHRQELSITRKDRENLNGHRGKVIWLTGLSGSGKSTIANALEKELHAQGKSSYILDGDNIRHGLNKDLGFTDSDRIENIRRVAEVSKLMLDAGLIVITAFISPFRAERQMARELIGSDDFIEVFVDTPLEVCEKRDPKGLYKKARIGEIPNMTGINSKYEAPEKADFIIKHGKLSIHETIQLLINFDHNKEAR